MENMLYAIAVAAIILAVGIVMTIEQWLSTCKVCEYYSVHFRERRPPNTLDRLGCCTKCKALWGRSCR